jgi:hypothetical protein
MYDNVVNMVSRGRVVERDVARLPDAFGAELAAVVQRLTGGLGQLSDAERLELVKATARLEAWTAAVRAQAVNAVFESAQAEQAAEQPADRAGQAGRAGGVARGSFEGSFEEQRWLYRRVACEVALVLGVSMWAADREVDLARSLAAHPPLRRALVEGRLDRAQALVICRALPELTSADPVRDRGVRGRLLARLLGPDDSPDGDDFDPAEPAYDIDEAGHPVGVVRELDPQARPEATLWALVPGRLRAILAREITRADPGAAARAAVAARDERRVGFEAQPSFMAELHLRTSAEAGAAAWTNLDAAARAAKTALNGTGDDRNLDQLRADIATGWLTEGTHGLHITRPNHPVNNPAQNHPDNAARNRPETSPSSADLDSGSRRVCLPRPRGPLVHLTVAATTVLGLDREPATLHGPTGPIPVPDTIARQLAHQTGARWRRLLYDPATGTASDLSRSYRPPDPIADYVRARDGHTTRHPTSCATHLELDHIQPYDHTRPSRGGTTTAANLATGGHRDHQLKTDRILTLTGHANHTLTITTPSGRTYPSHPHPYADPDPPPY